MRALLNLEQDILQKDGISLRFSNVFQEIGVGHFSVTIRCIRRKTNNQTPTNQGNPTNHAAICGISDKLNTEGVPGKTWAEWQEPDFTAEPVPILHREERSKYEESRSTCPGFTLGGLSINIPSTTLCVKSL
ncbi:MAG TPA: hypothetical protein PK509_02685 [Catalimonadaceae bacterium]|nr:hypothetical protein [Catalimonadaceae bacterium]